MTDEMTVRIRNITLGSSTAGQGLPTPIETGAAALYPYSSSLEFRFHIKGRYDWIKLFKVVERDGKKHLLLPREMCPMGPDQRVEGSDVEFRSRFVARNEEQTRVVAESADLLQQGRSHILEAPTGMGKTACTTEILARLGKKALVVVTKEDIRDQWVAAFKQFLGLTDREIGFIQGDRCEIQGKKVVIAMIQTLSREGKFTPDVFQDIGILVADEVHRVSADTFSEICWLIPAKLRLGLSATPTRKDGKDVVIFGHIGPVMVKAYMMKLKPKVLIVETGWKVPRVRRKIKSGGYRDVKLPHAAGRINHINKLLAKDTARNQLITQFIQQAYEKDRSVLMFSELKAHLEELLPYLRRAGIPGKDIAFYVGGLSKFERERAKRRKVLLATYAYCAEATDIPWADTLVLGTPRSDVIQIVGRILREHEGKKEPVVLDIVDRDSPVFDGYCRARLNWYARIGAETKFL